MCFSLIVASADPPRTVKSSPPMTTGRPSTFARPKTKFEAMEILNPLNVPCGPVLSMKELSEEPSLRATGTVVEVDHPTRGAYLTVGNPIKLSDSPVEVRRSPLLGEHTDEVLKQVLGMDDKAIEAAKTDGAL